MPKMVINTCYGGFSLSDAAHLRLGSVYVEADDTEYGFGYWNTNPWNQGMESHEMDYRSLPALVEVVELLCDEASGAHARLKVVDVPDDANMPYISEYDGREQVRESHRVWR